MVYYPRIFILVYDYFGTIFQFFLCETWTYLPASKVILNFLTLQNPLTGIFNFYIFSGHNTLYLKVHCPRMRPEVVVISDRGQTTTDFSDVSIGQSVLKSITIQNISRRTINVSFEPDHSMDYSHIPLPDSALQYYYK